MVERNLRTLVTWLSFNEMFIANKELLDLFEFDDFTAGELATEVRCTMFGLKGFP